MADVVWTRPVARKKHRCNMCFRVILPGEQYHRGALFDGRTAYTDKLCSHCYCVNLHYQWSEEVTEDIFQEVVIEWLSENHYFAYRQMIAGWRYPDGELVPPPLQMHCIDCGARIPDIERRCGTCISIWMDKVFAEYEARQEKWELI